MSIIVELNAFLNILTIQGPSAEVYKTSKNRVMCVLEKTNFCDFPSSSQLYLSFSFVLSSVSDFFTRRKKCGKMPEGAQKREREENGKPISSF